MTTQPPRDPDQTRAIDTGESGETVKVDKSRLPDAELDATQVSSDAGSPPHPGAATLDRARETTLSALRTAGRWTLIALGYVTAIALLGLMVKSGIEAWQVEAATRWETWGATAFCLLVIAYGAYRGLGSWRLAGFCALVLSLLVVYSALRFSTSDLQAFTLFGRPTEALLNPAFAIAILALLVGVWVLGRWPVWTRMLASVVLLYCGSAFVYGMLHNVGLESSFLGVDFFARIPFYFLQPTYFTIQVLFPLALLVLAWRWFAVRSQAPQRAQLIVLLALLVLLTDVVGFAAMSRNRVPNALSALFPPTLGVGEASTTFTDEYGRRVTARITTRDYDARKTDEDAAFYAMALSYAGSEGEERRFNLSVKDRSGRDVLFLDSADFELFEDGWKQSPSGVEFELGGVSTGQNIILLLDHSGSMQDVIDELKLAAKSFIDLKGRNDQILLLPFAAQPSPQPISDDPAALKAQVDQIAVAGGTGLYRAILEAYRQADALDGSTTIVVMTDGTPDADDKSAANQQALDARLAEGGIRVYSVGLGTEQYLDVPFLESLSRAGGGRTFLAESADQLKTIYQTIGAELQSNYTAHYQSSIARPELRIAAPQSGMVVSDTPFVAEVPNARQSRLDQVAFFVDGVMLAELEGTEETVYEIVLDVDAIEHGEHMLRVVATSATGEATEVRQPIEVVPAIEFRLVRPVQGDSVGDEVPIEADLVIRSGVTLTEFSIQVDEEPVATLTEPPFMHVWDSSGIEAGTHTVNTFATFSDGSTLVRSADIVIDKAMAIRFESPADGAELPPQVTLSVTVDNERASDPVERVEVFLGEESIGTADSRPFQIPWDTTLLSPGRQTLRALATTRSGASANAAIRTAIRTGALVVDLVSSDPPPAAAAASQVAEQPARVFLPPENVAIVLDASNSMWGRIRGGAKIDIAKQVLQNIVGMIPPETKVALRVYGNRSAVKRGNCTDTDLLQPLAPIDRPAMLAKLASVTPRGKTLIAYSLDEVAQDLKAAEGSSVVLLITDGIESCGGDPIDAARRLHEHGIDTRLHVIGYDVADAQQLADLMDIATAGGGQFFKADSSDELQEAIVEAATVEFAVLDEAGRVWLREKVSPASHPLRVGRYQLRIEVEPPIEFGPFTIGADQEQRYRLVQDKKTFRLEPE